MKSANLWHGLLFLHGHIADPDLARALAGRPVPSRAPKPSAPGVLGHMLYLGGRPMHAGHNFDVEEPFDVAPATAPHAGRTPLRAAEHPGQPVAC